MQSNKLHKNSHTVYCLGEKQGMIVNDDCSSCYNRVGDCLMSIWERRKEILYGKGLACKFSQNDPTLECEANGNNYYRAVDCE